MERGLVSNSAMHDPGEHFFRSRTIFLIAFLSLGGCEADVPPCWPAQLSSLEADPGSAGEPIIVDQTEIYLDTSGSMRGYLSTVAAAEVRESVFRRLINELPSLAELITQDSMFYYFGDTIREISVEEFQRSTLPSSFNDSQTQLDQVLNRIASHSDGKLSLVITDLFLSSKQFASGASGPIWRPTRKMLREGKTIGLIAVRNPFDYHIYDIPPDDRTIHNFKGERLFFVLIIGQEQQVSQLVRIIRREVLAELSPQHYRVMIFDPTPVSKQISIDTLPGSSAISVSPGVRPTDSLIDARADGLGMYRLSGEGVELRLHIPTKSLLKTDYLKPRHFEAELTIHAYYGSASDTDSACLEGWAVETIKVKLHRKEDQGDTLDVVLFDDAKSMAAFLDRTVYVADLRVYASSTGPEVLASWVSRWSFKPSEGPDLVKNPPPFFPTLNLERFGRVLADASGRLGKRAPIAQARFAFTVEY